MRPWLLPVLIAAVSLLSGCGSVKDDGPSAGGSKINVVLVDVAPHVPSACNPAWSSGGLNIAFETQAGSSAGRDVMVFAGGSLTKVTACNQISLANGGNVPAFAGTNLIYYRDHEDTSMRILQAASGQIENSPAPSLLFAFLPTEVGGGTITTPPEQMTSSSDKGKFLLRWSGWGTWLVDDTVTFTSVPDVSECVISSDGTRLAYVKPNGDVAHKTIGTSTETIIGQGLAVSWGGNDWIGFKKTNGDYSVYSRTTQAITTYWSDVPLQNPVISPDGTRVAFIASSSGTTYLAVGTFP